MNERDQKIAEHIAKFNAPKDAEFYWVSSNKDLLTDYKEECDLNYLMLKVGSGWFFCLEEGNSQWAYSLKHEPTPDGEEVACVMEVE